MTPIRSFATAFLFFLAGSFGAVWFGDGWRADLAGDPDEPAHAVTSLMVRDFVAGGHWSHPVAFAKEYYRDFPKVALGHYPPAYYVAGGLALLISPRPETLIALQALLLTAFGTLVFALARKALASPAAAAIAAAMAVLVPIIWRISLHVMADLLLACLCVLAVLAWTSFCEKPTKRRALSFGLWAALAILTKGSGLMLAAVPPVVLVLQGDWQRLRTWAWWLAAVPVVLLAGPWLYFTAGITREGMTGQTVPAFFRDAVAQYAQTVPGQLGYLWVALAAIGAGCWIGRGWRRALKPVEASLLGLLGGGVAIILLVPAGISDRYLAPLIPAMSILAVAGADRLAGLLPARARLWAGLALPIASLILAIEVPKKEVTGFARAVAYVLDLPQQAPGQDAWMVSSDPRGEGGVIAEAAFRLAQRSPSPLRIYRAGKELAASDWMGRGYHKEFTTEGEILDHLDKIGVQWVFVDLSVWHTLRQPHERLIETAMANAPDRWRLERREPVTRLWWVKGDLLIYRSVARSQKP